MEVAACTNSLMKERPDRPRPLSVLYVDDESILLDVCKRFLERRSDIVVTTAESVEKALALLETFRFDVILSDYQMPRTDGITFLKILQEKRCSIPFILFTGKGREEVVIEAINNGATYYIQKGGEPKSQFAELDHKIREASRRRQAEEALRTTELYYRTLFEHSGTAIAILDEDLKILQSNRNFSLLSGYSPGDITRVLAITALVPREDLQTVVDYFRLLYRGPDTVIPPFDARFITRDQLIRSLHVTIALIPTTGHCIASFIDLSPPYHPPEEKPAKSADISEICCTSRISQSDEPAS